MNNDRTFDQVFGVLTDYLAWNEKYLKKAKGMLAQAEQKPATAEHSSNLYMDDDRQVWQGFGSNGWHRLVRESNQPYAPYKVVEKVTALSKGRGRERDEIQSFTRPDGAVVTFIANSYDCFTEDWGWEIRFPTAWPPPRPTAESYRSSIRTYEHSIAFARRLLKERPHIEAWITAQAKLQGPARQHDGFSTDDIGELRRAFAPDTNRAWLSDIGRLSCGVSEMIDQLAFGWHRGYCC